MWRKSCLRTSLRPWLAFSNSVNSGLLFHMRAQCCLAMAPAARAPGLGTFPITLPERSLLRCSRAARDDQLWRELCIRSFNTPRHELMGVTWRALYKCAPQALLTTQPFLPSLLVALIKFLYTGTGV